MHCNILFNGCSITKGGELEGIDNDLEHQKIHRFSHLVSEHFNVSYENISSSGKSNDWIVEKTINWFESGNTCDLAVIQLTEQKRITLYDEDLKAYHICHPILKDGSKFSQIMYDNKNKLRKLSNAYYKDIYTEYFGVQNLCKNLFFINLYLKHKNIPTVFLKLKDREYNYTSGWKTKCKDIKIKSIIGEIIPVSNFLEDTNKKYFCKDYSHLFDYEKNQHAVFLNGGHPNEYSHQLIAEYIINEIKYSIKKFS